MMVVGYKNKAKNPLFSMKNVSRGYPKTQTLKHISITAKVWRNMDLSGGASGKSDSYFLLLLLLGECSLSPNPLAYTPCPHRWTAPPLSASPPQYTWFYNLLQLVNVYCYITITPNPQFILGFILGVVHSVGYDKYIMTCIYYYSIIENCFSALKINCALLIHISCLYFERKRRSWGGENKGKCS